MSNSTLFIRQGDNDVWIIKKNYFKIGNSSLKSNNFRHRGHVRSILNHSSKHSRWNVWLQGNVSVFFKLKFSKQIKHRSSVVDDALFCEDFFADCSRYRLNVLQSVAATDCSVLSSSECWNSKKILKDLWDKKHSLGLEWCQHHSK